MEDSKCVLLPESQRFIKSDDKAVKIFVCGFEECDYNTGRKNNLVRHVTGMHSPSSKVANCVACNTKLKSKAEVRKHRREFHSKGYKCSNCTLAFSKPALLKRHQFVHTKKKPFQCKKCKYSTSHKSNLKRHAKSIHKENELLKRRVKTRPMSQKEKKALRCVVAMGSLLAAVEKCGAASSVPAQPASNYFEGCDEFAKRLSAAIALLQMHNSAPCADALEFQKSSLNYSSNF